MLPSVGHRISKDGLQPMDGDACESAEIIPRNVELLQQIFA